MVVASPVAQGPASPYLNLYVPWLYCSEIGSISPGQSPCLQRRNCVESPGARRPVEPVFFWG